MPRKGTKAARSETPPDQAALQQKAEKFLKLRERGAKLYGQADELLAELQAGLGVDQVLPIGGGQGFAIRDPFVNKKTGQPCKLWRHVPVGRRDHEVVTIDDPPAE